MTPTPGTRQAPQLRHATPFARIQPALAYAVAHLNEDLPLAAIAARAGLSAFHAQRLFRGAVGESPKQYVLRLRLSRAAAMLLSGDASVLRIAQECGFRSHEVFSRRFHRQFGLSPRAYRARGLTPRLGRSIRRTHAAVVKRVGPCVGLYHLDARPSQRQTMSYSVVRKELNPQPVLMVKRRIQRSAVAATIGGTLPLIFQYAQQHGIALDGHPLTRYSDMGFELVTVEPGMRIADRGHAVTAHESGDVVEVLLPGGPAATTVHVGPYDTLRDAYAAIESWIETNGLETAGAPWEYYVTDPAEHPDPKDWRTEVFWPLR